MKKPTPKKNYPDELFVEHCPVEGMPDHHVYTDRDEIQQSLVEAGESAVTVVRYVRTYAVRFTAQTVLQEEQIPEVVAPEDR